MAYIDALNRSSLSAKSRREYYAALTQFLRWCSVMSYIQSNPAVDIKPKFKASKKPQEQRERWQLTQLCILFDSDAFKTIDERLRWVTYLITYQGLRPNEACQPRVIDVETSSDIPFIRITDDGRGQRLKNQYAERQVPIHHTLIELGFLDYVAERKHLAHLFDFRPGGYNNDWSVQYRNQLGSLLTKIGFKAGQRPTAYGLRHTFIDELKKRNVQESLVAEIVGHSHPTMTYGRYGKTSSLSQMRDAINLFDVQGGANHA